MNTLCIRYAYAMHTLKWNFTLILCRCCLQDVVNNLDVHPNQTRVGAVYWSESATVQFRLSESPITILRSPVYVEKSYKGPVTL